jgi:hypothetical protein
MGVYRKQLADRIENAESLLLKTSGSHVIGIRFHPVFGDRLSRRDRPRLVPGANANFTGFVEVIFIGAFVETIGRVKPTENVIVTIGLRNEIDNVIVDSIYPIFFANSHWKTPVKK